MPTFGPNWKEETHEFKEKKNGVIGIRREYVYIHIKININKI